MGEVDGRKRGVRKERRGVVLGKSGDKTAVVLVERRKKHGLYGKMMRVRKKFQVHDENNKAAPGDKVRIVESRPISKRKRWRLAEVLAAHGQ